MYWIFKVVPNFIWWLLPLIGIAAFISSYVNPLKLYEVPVKLASTLVLLIGIYILGLFHADQTWTQAAESLRQKIVTMEQASTATNETIKEKIVVKREYYKERGNDIIQYVDREVIKTDSQCIISPEFVTAHNKAATK